MRGVITRALLGLCFASPDAWAVGPLIPWEDSGTTYEAPVDIYSDGEKVMVRPSLAAHLGLTSDDAVFATPRQFRSDSLNSSRFDIEPMTSEEIAREEARPNEGT